jgi:hypothetical protein
MAAPPDAACVEIDVSGARSTAVRKDVMPGQMTVFTLNGLPIGTDTFSGATFPVPCASAMGQTANWIADPVQVFLSIGSVAPVTLNMHRNGQASVGVNYTDDDSGAQCPAGLTQCMPGGPCVSIPSDPNNCGKCGLVCPAGDACQNGACLPGMCPPPNLLCAGACVNPSSDANNCGACGTKCAAGAVCQNAACVPAPMCPAPNVMCGTQCLNPSSDLNNCGGCGVVCSSANMSMPSCAGGVCNGICAPGFADCNNNKQTDGCETNVSTNVSSCGACGVVCSSNNMATVSCGGAVCNGTCAAGFADCDNNKLTDGCETNLSTDVHNCGACGMVCATGTTCVSGACH